MSPPHDRDTYKSYATEAARLLRASGEAQRRLADAEAARTGAYGEVEDEWVRLDGYEERAAATWRELTTRFGPHATGDLPEPDERTSGDADELLKDAHRLVREPVHYALTGRYVRMAALGLAAAVAISLAGLLLTKGMHGPVRLAGFLPALAAPWIGRVAATTWIRRRTSHEEREYAADTAVAGMFGGGGVWIIAVIVLVVHLVT